MFRSLFARHAAVAGSVSRAGRGASAGAGVGASATVSPPRRGLFFGAGGTTLPLLTAGATTGVTHNITAGSACTGEADSLTAGPQTGPRAGAAEVLQEGGSSDGGEWLLLISAGPKGRCGALCHWYEGATVATIANKTL